MNNYTRSDLHLLRGVAILLIIVHNFCHVLPGFVQENECLWSIDSVLQYNQFLLHGGPHLILNLFSHYGFLGITLFVFLSGYGLASKYDRQSSLPLVPYIVRHALKLWRLIFVGLLVFYAACRLLGGFDPSWDHIVKLSAFVANLLPKRPFVFGPWWWFSLMMQFYVIFYFIYYRRCLRTITLFALCCLLLQIAVTFYCRNELSSGESLSCMMHYNFPPLILPFTLGVYMARCQPAWIHSRWLLLAAVVIVIAGSYNKWIWCLTNAAGCIALLQISLLLRNTRWISSALAWIGKISAWIFVIHPIVRRYVFSLNDSHSVYFTLALYLLITLLLSYIVYVIMKYIDSQMQQEATRSTQD